MWSVPFDITSFEDNRNFVMTHISYQSDNIPITTLGSDDLTYVRGRQTWTVEIQEQ